MAGKSLRVCNILRNFANMKHVYVALLVVLLMGCKEETLTFQTEVLNSFTPVKNQGRSSLCWAYAMLAAIETEHIMRGDSVNLSAAYVAEMVEREKDAPPTKRGVGQTLLNMIAKYGVVPYESMRTTEVPAPRWAFMLGSKYTPQEFARSVCAPGEYIGLGSSSKHPYYQRYVFDVPDNWEHNELFNVPADTLLAVTERAVRQGRGVCWEGDISEIGFDWQQGVARTSFFSGSTTDDHCMAIVGLARDAEGCRYFIMKNSWGKGNAHQGLMYMQFDYFMKKTLAVYLPKEALGFRV